MIETLCASAECRVRGARVAKPRPRTMARSALLHVAVVVALSILPNAEALLSAGRPSTFSSIDFILARSIADPTRSMKYQQPTANSLRDAVVVLRSTPIDEDTEIMEENTPAEELSVLDKINKFLDTPILDANNRSDQGAVTEALKEFVRDEPEVAQVTFSVAVVAILVLLTKIITSL